MTSYLIDLVLFTALVLTSWRTGRMVLELKRLRSEESRFHQSLKEAEVAINQAAHAIVMLRSEGVAAASALGTAVDEARELSEQLDDAVRMAELRLTVANDVDGRDDAARSPTQENWLSLIESRLGSASAVNR